MGTGAGAEAPKTQHNSRQLLYVTLSLVLASADTQLQACTVQTALFGSRCNKTVHFFVWWIGIPPTTPYAPPSSPFSVACLVRQRAQHELRHTATSYLFWVGGCGKTYQSLLLSKGSGPQFSCSQNGANPLTLHCSLFVMLVHSQTVHFFVWWIGIPPTTPYAPPSSPFSVACLVRQRAQHELRHTATSSDFVAQL